MAIVVSYGSFNFTNNGLPNPSININKNMESTPGEDFCLYSPIEIELNGNIITTGFQNVVDKINQLESIFVCNSGCNTLLVQCDSNDPFINASAKVTSFNVQPRTEADIFANTASYTITLQTASLTGVINNGTSGITAISEDWNIEFLDEQVGGSTSGVETGTISLTSAYNITHNVTVTVDSSSCNGYNSLSTAESYINNEIGSDPSQAKSTILFNPASLNYYNHFRVLNKNVYEGTVTLNETWIASESGALEDFNVNIDTSLDTDLRTITVNGNIQGLTTISYAAATGVPKIKNAIDYWKIISGNIYSRATTVYNGDRNLNNVPLTTSMGYNSKAGTVTYNYVYDDRPANCVAEAKSEKINITENNPNDVFASLTILGRTPGPLFQDISTSGARTREISIEAILPVETGCSYLAFKAPTGYDDIINSYQAGLLSDYDQVFVNNETKTWAPKDGRFTYSKSWTVGECG